MGQPLPLPERIPSPIGKVKIAMNECGIVIHDEPDQQYVKYSLPDGWEMIDRRWRWDLPIFYIVDDKKMVRFSITGAWKETYDNVIELNLVKDPYELEDIPNEDKE